MIANFFLPFKYIFAFFCVIYLVIIHRKLKKGDFFYFISNDSLKCQKNVVWLN